MRWDKILAANAAQAWAPEQQRRRDQMTRLLFELTRNTSGEDRDEQEPAGNLAPRAAPEPIERPIPDPVPAAESLQRTETEAPERPAPGLLPAGEPVQTAAEPPGDAKPDPAAEPAPETASESASQPVIYGIHLASFSNQANAHRSWTQLQAQHPDLLNRQDPGPTLRRAERPRDFRKGDRRALRHSRRRPGGLPRPAAPRAILRRPAARLSRRRVTSCGRG